MRPFLLYIEMGELGTLYKSSQKMVGRHILRYYMWLPAPLNEIFSDYCCQYIRSKGAN